MSSLIEERDFPFIRSTTSSVISNYFRVFFTQFIDDFVKDYTEMEKSNLLEVS